MRYVLVVEDDQSTRERIATMLLRQPMIEVETAANREAAKMAIARRTFDLAIIDIDLGRLTGGESDRYGGVALMPLLGNAGTTTIVVSGLGEDNLPDVTLALKAFDFLTKPFSDAQLNTKVEQALALREVAGARALRLEIGTYSDPNVEDDPHHTPGLLWKKRPVRLTITEYRLVYKLLRANGNPLDRSVLAEEMDSATSSGALATHMSSIKKKFKEKDASFNSLKTEPGVGYVWKG